LDGLKLAEISHHSLGKSDKLTRGNAGKSRTSGHHKARTSMKLGLLLSGRSEVQILPWTPDHDRQSIQMMGCRFYIRMQALSSPSCQNRNPWFARVMVCSDLWKFHFFQCHFDLLRSITGHAVDDALKLPASGILGLLVPVYLDQPVRADPVRSLWAAAFTRKGQRLFCPDDQCRS